MKQKKILLLGGSSQQVTAIEKAKKRGYYTVLCDYLLDNPGQFIADRFYPVSTTDKESILRIAEAENVSGIVAYSSDPAAPTAAYVAEKLNLPGISYNIAKCFCEKHLFREFLKLNGFNVPGSIKIDKNSNLESISQLEFPIIVKPTDSSGSKGVNVIHNREQFESAKMEALKFSRNNILIAEEFIERNHSDVIEAEIFVVNGEVKIWGLINSIRDKYTNPLLPAAYSYPLNVSSSYKKMVKQEICRLISCSKIKYGAFNIEMIISKSNKLYFLDAGPRNGGNMLPEFISEICHNDLTMATICAAMGDYQALKNLELDGDEGGDWGLSVLHAKKSGVFREIYYTRDTKASLYKEHLFIEKGERVNRFNTSRDAIGLAFFHFSDRISRDQILNDFNNQYIKVILE